MYGWREDKYFIPDRSVLPVKECAKIYKRSAFVEPDRVCEREEGGYIKKSGKSCLCGYN